MCSQFTRHGQSRHQHVFLAHYKIRGVQGGQLKTVTVSDRVRWAGLHAITAKNAPVVVDVVNLGVTLGTGNALLSRVLGRFYVDAV